MKQKFDITGMSCSACSAAVERSVKKLSGLRMAEVSLLTNSMTAEYDETVLTSGDIIKAVEKAGYGAKVHESKSATPKKEKQEKRKNMSQNEHKNKVRYKIEGKKD